MCYSYLMLRNLDDYQGNSLQDCCSTDMKDIAQTLKDVDYDGYASAEVFPWPNPDAAAEQTIRAFRECFSMS